MVRFVLTLLAQTINHSCLATCKKCDAVKGMNEIEELMKHGTENKRASGPLESERIQLLPSGSRSQSTARGPAVSALPMNFLEMQILESHPRSTD